MGALFNAEEPHVAATVPVGAKPVGVAVSVHDQVFVTNSGGNSVSVIDASATTVTATVTVGFFPESVGTDPQFGTYVANNGGGTVSVMDRLNTVVTTLVTGGPPGPAPHSARVAIDHFMSRAYVTNRGGDRLSVIRTSSNPPLLLPHPVDVPGPLGVVVDPADHRLYVTQPELDRVSVVDPATHDVVTTVPVGPRPTGIAIDSQRRRLYVANSGSTTVSVIDLATGVVVHVDMLAHPVGVAVDARGDAYVSHSDGTVKVIDAGSGSVSATIPVGAKPEGVAFEPHGNRVYVANSGAGTVSVIDLAD